MISHLYHHKNAMAFIVSAINLTLGIWALLVWRWHALFLDAVRGMKDAEKDRTVERGVLFFKWAIGAVGAAFVFIGAKGFFDLAAR